MAIAFGGLIGSATSTASTTTLTITVGAGGVPAGALVLVGVATFNYSSGAFSVTDSKLNNYQSDNSSNTGGNGGNDMLSSVITTALVSGDTIVVAVPAGDQSYASEAFYFTGIATSAWHYQSTAFAAKASSTAPSVSMALVTPPSPMLFIAESFAVYHNYTLTPPSGWTDLTRVQSGTGAADIMLDIGYRIETATPTSETYTPTYSTALAPIMGMDAYKGIAGVAAHPARSFLDYAGMP